MKTIYIENLKSQDFIVNVGLVSSIAEYANCFVVYLEFGYGGLTTMKYSKSTLITIRTIN
jgi:hypothetical protein